MSPPLEISFYAALLVLFLANSATAQQGKTFAEAKGRDYPLLPENVERRQVTIWSDGTRMAS